VIARFGGTVPVSCVGNTPTSAARFLLARVGRRRGVAYARAKALEHTIRGRAFWLAVAEILTHDVVPTEGA
jgi:hypothetical protein